MHGGRTRLTWPPCVSLERLVEGDVEVDDERRTVVLGSHGERGTHDGAAYFEAVEQEPAAHVRLATVGRFGRRKARNEQQAATQQAATVRAQIRDAWGEPPRTAKALPAWAPQAAARQAEADELRALPAGEAARRIETSRVEQDPARQRGAERARGLHDPYRSDPHREGPARSL